MVSEDELAQWLQSQPLDAPVAIDGESVYLKIYPHGAQLGAYLMHAYTQEQLQHALQQGFSCAIDFEAGLGLSPDGKSLILTQWLRHASNWSQAAKPLENILNQLTLLRAALVPVALVPTEMVRAPGMHARFEQRLRLRFVNKA